jgi:hypothetical protein
MRRKKIKNRTVPLIKYLYMNKPEDNATNKIA